MIKTKLIKILFISACMVTFSSSAAFAAAVEDQTASAEGETAAYEGGEQVDSKIYAKQVEIDQLLFKDYAKEIENMGFTVTSTFPTDSYVEIGITPYSDANADFIYEILGKELIKVVEEEQVELLNPEVVYMQASDTEVSTSDTDKSAGAEEDAVNETDASKAADSGMAVTDAATAANIAVIADGEAAEMEIQEDAGAEEQNNLADDPEVLAYTTGEAAAETEAGSLIPVILACVAGAAVIIGGTVFWIKKRNNLKR